MAQRMKDAVASTDHEDFPAVECRQLSSKVGLVSSGDLNVQPQQLLQAVSGCGNGRPQSRVRALQCSADTHASTGSQQRLQGPGPAVTSVPQVRHSAHKLCFVSRSGEAGWSSVSQLGTGCKSCHAIEKEVRDARNPIRVLLHFLVTEQTNSAVMQSEPQPR